MSACVAYDELNETVHNKADVMRINVPEHFDYRSIHIVRQLCKKTLDNTDAIEVDMSATRYLDSSGIALLMCINHWVKAPAVTIHVTHCSSELQRILSVARLSKNIIID